MKDIFIDNNIAKNFATPVDVEYKELIKWLIEYDSDKVLKNPAEKENYAHLVVNQKILVEYLRSSYNCHKATAIPTIIALLTKQGRIIKFDNNTIKEIKDKKFTKVILRKLLSNEEDHCHICTVINSSRKKALSNDENFTKDLSNFPGIKILVTDRPEKINYRE